MSEETKIIEDFISKLIENMEDMDPEISKLIDEHFWELVGEDDGD